MSSYRLIIPNTIKTKMTSWNLSREVLLQVWNRLNSKLAREPDKQLGDRLVPLQDREYSFVIEDKQQLPRLHHFLFAVLVDEDAKTLTLTGCRHSTPAPDGN